MVENHAPIITAFVEDIGRDHRGPGFSFPLHVYMLQDGKGHEVRIPLLKQRFRAYAYFRHGRKDFRPAGLDCRPPHDGMAHGVDAGDLVIIQPCTHHGFKVGILKCLVKGT